MSAASAWAYTSKATHWARLSRDDWTGVQAWSAPVVFACDYKAESARMTNADGIEFTSKQQIYTERASIAQGDMVLIGAHTTASPIDAGAHEVRSVMRYADTFDGLADDYMVAT